MNDEQFKFSASVIVLPFLVVLILWIVFWGQIRLGWDIVDLGVYPRTLSGLKGVVLSPFIHGDLSHIANNSIPLLILIAALRFFYRDLTFKVLLWGLLGSGILTWLIARNSYHIGASSVIYVLVSFIFLKGIRSGYYRLVALSLTVIMIYGGMIWYVFPDVEKGISWEGHLSGMIVGLVLAVLYKTPDYQAEIRYDWQRPDYDPSNDKFMQRFDENGNFVNPPPPVVELPEIVEPRFVYHFVPDTQDADREEKKLGD